MRPFLQKPALTLLVILHASYLLAQSPTSNFALTGSLNTARMFQTTTVLDNGKVLVAGGVDGFSYNTISSAELYDPTTGTFTYTGSLNTGRIFPSATLLNNGKVLIAGGADSNWNNIGTAELYDPVAGTFSFTGNLVTARNTQTATVLNNGKVLLAGGVSSNGDWITGLAAPAEVYDPVAGTFSSTGSLNTARDCHTATLLNNGQVLIVGGNDVNGNALASAELYDPATGTFTVTGGLNNGRAVHTATLLNNGKVLVVGGYNTNGDAVAAAELYDPAAGTFTVTGSMNTPRYDMGDATLLNNGMVLIAGGQDTNGNTIASAELYDPTSGTFTVTGTMNTTRQSLTATLLGNGQVLVAAGMDYYANVLASAELYQPSTMAPAAMVSIAVSPQNPSVAVGASQQMMATGTFSDNSTQTLASVTWSSSNSSVATVSNDASNLGEAWGVASGTATLTACTGAICGSTTLMVTGVPAGGSPVKIIATATPAPNAAGWNNSSVTVSFTCSDTTSQIATCSSPQTVTTQGAGQVVSGTGTDSAGNSATTSVALNIDETPPTLTVTSPSSGTTVSASPVSVTGSASDSLSGVSSVACNGAPAILSGSGFSCQVGLVNGSNTIMVLAMDAAGNQVSQAVAIFLSSAGSNPPPNNVYITPSSMALVVGEPRGLALVDDYGRVVPSPTWTVSDTTVAQISTDGSNTLTGLAAGTVTITATYQSLTAQATATVFAGPTLPDGTVRWSVPPVSGYSTLKIVQAQPASGTPDVYIVEQGATTSQLMVRGLTVDGQQLWATPVTLGAGDPPSLVKAVGDGVGGVLVQSESSCNSYPCGSQIVRVDGVTGLPTWQYNSPGWLYHDWALHPDGTIYVGEIPNLSANDVQILAIDGTTGMVKSRVAIPGSSLTYSSADGSCPAWAETPFYSSLGPPMIAPDGSMNVEVATFNWDDDMEGNTCWPTFGEVVQDAKLLLLRMPSGGAPQWTTLREDQFNGVQGTGPKQPYYTAGEVIPDGQGGLLAAWTFNYATSYVYDGGEIGWMWDGDGRITHLSGSGQGEYTVLPNVGTAWYYPGLWGGLFPPDAWSFVPNRSLVLGENGTAFAAFQEGEVASFDVESGTVHWTWNDPSWNSFDLIAATAGNGLVVEDDVVVNTTTWQTVPQIVRLDSTGTATTDAWMTVPPSQSTSVDPTSLLSLDYELGNQWLASVDPAGADSGSAISAAAVFWPNSSFPQGAEDGTRKSYHHYDFELFFCAANLCSPHLDVAFIYYQANPEEQTSPSVNLTPSQEMAVRVAAMRALKMAFAGYPVRMGTASEGMHEIWVNGDSTSMQGGDEGCGGTPPFMAGFPVTSIDLYIPHMEFAQWALNLQISPTTADNQPAFGDLVNAIGTSIGNTAAHEIGHQLGLAAMDDTSVGTYNGRSCGGSTNPAVYTGRSADGTPIHWEDITARSLRTLIYGP